MATTGQGIGRAKIYSTLLVDSTTSHDSDQFVDVMMRFISKPGTTVITCVTTAKSFEHSSLQRRMRQ